MDLLTRSSTTDRSSPLSFGAPAGDKPAHPQASASPSAPLAMATVLRQRGGRQQSPAVPNTGPRHHATPDHFPGSFTRQVHGSVSRGRSKRSLLNAHVCVDLKNRYTSSHTAPCYPRPHRQDCCCLGRDMSGSPAVPALAGSNLLRRGTASMSSPSGTRLDSTLANASHTPTLVHVPYSYFDHRERNVYDDAHHQNTDRTLRSALHFGGCPHGRKREHRLSGRPSADLFSSGWVSTLPIPTWCTRCAQDAC